MKDLTEKVNKSGPSFYLRFLRFIEKITRKKFLIRLFLIIFIIFVIFFPSNFGELVGNWYYNITNSFMKSLK